MVLIWKPHHVCPPNGSSKQASFPKAKTWREVGWWKEKDAKELVSGSEGFPWGECSDSKSGTDSEYIKGEGSNFFIQNYLNI